MLIHGLQWSNIENIHLKEVTSLYEMLDCSLEVFLKM